jgi:hypothetical protein
MACFSCGEGKDRTAVEMIQFYKKVYEKTGVGYVYFEKIGVNEILIMESNDFSKFKAKNKKAFQKGQYEFAHVSEFKESISN